MSKGGPPDLDMGPEESRWLDATGAVGHVTEASRQRSDFIDARIRSSGAAGNGLADGPSGPVKSARPRARACAT